MKGKSLLLIVLSLLLVLGLGGSIVGLWEARAEESQAPSEAPLLATNVGTAFTYQGRLVKDGNPVNGTCNFWFSLWDAAESGTQIGSTQVVPNVEVSNGLFTAQINGGGEFGGTPFNGQARWLEIMIRCPAASGDYVLLAPRQPLTPTPYALALPGLWTQQTGTTPSIIGGYRGNEVTAGVYGATISGGGWPDYPNRVTGDLGTVGGGYGNEASHSAATVSGGGENTASGEASTIGGGYRNEAGPAATVSGGADNIASGESSAIGGGWMNVAGADYATVPGGFNNSASGYSSFAAGNRAKANHQGAFVWADSTSADFASTANNQFRVRAYGGVQMFTGANSLYVESSGTGLSGPALYAKATGGAGIAIWGVNNSSDSNLVLTNTGTGPLIKAFSSGGDVEFKVDNNGNVYADGTYTSPASDYAEILPAVYGLKAGDVLVVGPDGRLTRSTRAYQPTVIGVYSTNPGFVGGAGDDVNLMGKVPLAIAGVVPVKASTENGPISPGDLLVASSTPGHAMRGGDEPPIGTVIGKALEGLEEGTGVIQMLVMLQ